MTCNIAGWMLETEIQGLTMDCKNDKVQAVILPPYHQVSD